MLSPSGVRNPVSPSMICSGIPPTSVAITGVPQESDSNTVFGKVSAHAAPNNPEATIVGDLSTDKSLPTATFDCMILTQTFQCIPDITAAVLNVHTALNDGGVLLATFPGISQISRYDMDRWGDYWRFTDASVRHLLGHVFGGENVKVETHGNVLVACSFLQGLAAEELTKEELDFHDDDYPVLITARAVKDGKR